MAEKMYILDTNVLIYDPSAIFSFKDRLVGIPIIVLEELDEFKSERSERGNNARHVIRYLDGLRERGSLRTGVLLDNGSTLQILFAPERGVIKTPLKADIADNVVLLTALYLKEKEKYEVHFVSKDINARVKADVLGIPAVDYLRGNIDEERFFKGWITLDVPAVQLKKEFPDELVQLAKKGLVPNEFVCLSSRNNPLNYRVFRYLGGDTFKSVIPPKFQWSLEPRNAQQLMALDLLMDPHIQLVSLIGPAGTGKTFLTLLAGLHQVLFTHVYEKILISRPVIPLGPDIGYLPGDIQEKLFSWMQPVYDNMELILHSATTQQHIELLKEEARERRGRGRRVEHKRERRPSPALQSVEQLINMGKISLEAITYMRGRSIPYQFIFIDEVQNLNPHEVKTLITRVGEGSKIIIAGDPFQIDSPYLDFSSNGLIVASDKFKNKSIFGTVFLETSERSELSRLASELL